MDYVVQVVTATRRPEQFGMPDVRAWIAFGASPRASLGIIARPGPGPGARPGLRRAQDIIGVIPDVLRHRLVLTYDALADDVKADTVIAGSCRLLRCLRSTPFRNRTFGFPDGAAGGSAVAPAASAIAR